MKMEPPTTDKGTPIAGMCKARAPPQRVRNNPSQNRHIFTIFREFSPHLIVIFIFVPPVFIDVMP
jgi:hypothetical protein